MMIVTGTKRSGTSMWMQILIGAGYPIIGEAFPMRWEHTIKAANPEGFYESHLRRSPTVLVDAAHNPHGARALGRAIDDSFEFNSLVGVVGMLGDKDAHGFLAALEPTLNEVVITRPSSPRAMDPGILGAIAVDVFGDDRVTVEADLPAAVDRALAIAEASDAYGGVGVLITGSVVLVGDAKRLLA